uniref:Scavenger mRNA-decapping enzyme DcpS n=1 Tax=Sexangularia sp. CB-2014 TaxID=1486929 RepID=A0A7S1VPM1_9EUKA|mmetsp:Transcript_765/g.2355  ORF Transcript_765/g.2355 Transcript_765/m.2355 type:complete len:288 (+) Transcript_765:85-948(+)
MENPSNYERVDCISTEDGKMNESGFIHLQGGREGGRRTLWLVRSVLDAQAVQHHLSTGQPTLVQENDRFSQWHCEPSLEVTQICPATDADVTKYTTGSSIFQRETADLYAAVTEPYIASLPPVAWVANIINGTAEADRVVGRTDDWLLSVDTKWDGVGRSQLYLCGLAVDSSLRSIRDLRGVHLPQLRALRTEVLRVAKERYNLPANEVLTFFHYQPTFYWLHVHVIATTTPRRGSGFDAWRAILLDDVIDNLTRDAEYYSHASFTYALDTQSGLAKAFAAHVNNDS